MAGISTIYCIGSGGGFMGQDGVNPILAQIWVGEADRMWFEARYFSEEFGPLGSLRVLVPAAPDHDDNLLDACIAFFPAAFEDCPSFPDGVEQLVERETLNFHLEPGSVPQSWSRLREEAREPFANLGLWRAAIEPVEREDRAPDVPVYRGVPGSEGRMKVRHYPLGYRVAQHFPGASEVRVWEGGCAYTAERDGKPYLILDEGTMADFLDPIEDKDLLDKLVEVIEFENEEDRSQYIETELPPPTGRPWSDGEALEGGQGTGTSST